MGIPPCREASTQVPLANGSDVEITQDQGAPDETKTQESVEKSSKTV